MQMFHELFVASQSNLQLQGDKSNGEGEERRRVKKKKKTQGHVLFGSALKWSFRGTGCSQSDVRPMAGQSQGKPADSPLQE